MMDTGIKILYAVLISAVISQGIKIIIHTIKDKRAPSMLDLVVTGGMPSTHSAMVSSLFAILFLIEGVSSAMVISLVFLIIVVTDSLGVRRTAGEEAMIVNKIISLERLRINRIHYALGHKPVEVVMGLLIGILVSAAVFAI